MKTVWCPSGFGWFASMIVASVKTRLSNDTCEKEIWETKVKTRTGRDLKYFIPGKLNAIADFFFQLFKRLHESL